MIFINIFFNDTATTEIYTLSLHDALPIWSGSFTYNGAVGLVPETYTNALGNPVTVINGQDRKSTRLNQSLRHLVCRLLLEKKKNVIGHLWDVRFLEEVRTADSAIRLFIVM